MMVIGCMGTFLGIWFVLLKTRRPKALKYRVPAKALDASEDDRELTAVNR